MRKRRILGMTMVLGVIVSLLASTAALAQDSSTPATAEAVTFDVGVDSDITSLNPFNLCCGPDYEVMNLMYDIAIGFDNDTLEAAPQIVTSWEHSEDYMDWTMDVREGATFNDGSRSRPRTSRSPSRSSRQQDAASTRTTSRSSPPSRS